MLIIGGPAHLGFIEELAAVVKSTDVILVSSITVNFGVDKASLSGNCGIGF